MAKRKHTRVANRMNGPDWRIWSVVFVLGIVLGGGIGGALAYFGVRADGILASQKPEPETTIESLIQNFDAEEPMAEENRSVAKEPPPIAPPQGSLTSVDRDADHLSMKDEHAAFLDRRALADESQIQKRPLSPIEAPGPASLEIDLLTEMAPVAGAVPAAISPEPAAAMKAVETSSEPPLWIRNSVAASLPDRKPAIAIVLDDVGVARAHAEMAIDLPAEITLSFMTYADGVEEMAMRARGAGHELMLHFPMEPLDPALDTGPNALLVGLEREEILRRLSWGLSRFDGYIGMNNHMGSRFTNDPRGMQIVLEELHRRGLLFLDSLTSADSVGPTLARSLSLPHATRDIFLDNEVSAGLIERQLREAERIALERGDAIAIGHPHPETVAALRTWIPEARARGIEIVPLSALVRRRLGAAG